MAAFSIVLAASLSPDRDGSFPSSDGVASVHRTHHQSQFHVLGSAICIPTRHSNSLFEFVGLEVTEIQLELD